MRSRSRDGRAELLPGRMAWQLVGICKCELPVDLSIMLAVQSHFGPVWRGAKLMTCKSSLATSHHFLLVCRESSQENLGPQKTKQKSTQANEHLVSVFTEPTEIGVQSSNSGS